LEVLIEREGTLDAEALHHNPADAVGETPLFVGEVFEGGPSVGKILVVDANNFGPLPLNYMSSKGDRTMILTARPK
jgi:hypothetical protein